jgi:PAS domain S-box-containing protein
MSLVRTDDDEPPYLVGIIQDMSERRASESVLQRYELLWTAAPDIMLVVRRRDARILDANRAAETAYGHASERLRELTLFDLLADSRAHVLEQLEQATRGGLLFEAVHRRADGTLFPVEVSSRGVMSEGGEEVVLSVVRDIGGRRSVGRGGRGPGDRA